MVARWHDGSDDELDNAHLMRMAGRFARRVRAWGHAHGVEVIDCKADERKHLVAEEYLATHTVATPRRRPAPRRCRRPPYRPGRKPATWTKIDQDYDTLRVDMQTLFADLRLVTAE